ncbi:putative S-adenosyl-L-methionine-dependent methyltransferase [Mycobacterium kubicae]|uniref:S-adenosyl-L-methionine-dependent methyltransferase n=1 Tax=Mycobacterium kubicae TaxID=120959 RepID=A0AAX1JET7_9MYCO|nr:class I SAM-dependent methyltransferase [Mycobacterium kubicae]MCV7095463.1 class I SAM-dependent methyltransferase [Mycobacterium kubicae]ORV94117.1 hypothetical protein AWC13_23010 [Mycobacterium kubicae]QNI11815.1 class I SAM-dependent methyltransferase [Mycobacterium kubicae]QPI40038.1 class I SAM-dependent methyltransferase [Mycobacterium kubicae]GFG64723.1 putative S-adenosyl-L-methionine-dependent methyltransferase [Mycobacterium kubicae]
MTRTSDDSWDLKTGVGTTATMVAAARAVASRQSDPVIDDPFAELLVRAVDLDLFTQIVDGTVDFEEIGADWAPWFFGIRGRAFDEFFGMACQAGIRQAVILASGLDCRAYRLKWPSAMSVYEIDQPEVINWKQAMLADLGHTPTVRHHPVGIDLRHDWPIALREAGFDPATPTAWIAEGLLIGYLPPSAQKQILNSVTALSARGSRIAADHFCGRHDILAESLNDMHEICRQRDPNVNLRDLTFPGGREDPAVHLAKRGWVTHNAQLTDLFRVAGRPAPARASWPAAVEFMRFLTGMLA